VGTCNPRTILAEPARATRLTDYIDAVADRMRAGATKKLHRVHQLSGVFYAARAIHA